MQHNGMFKIKKKGLGNSHNVAKEVGMCRNRVKESQMKQWKQPMKKHIWKVS